MKTALQAAQEVAALINTRPHSPRVDELEAIIAGVTTRQHACAHTVQDDPSLCDLEQRLVAVERQYRDVQHCDEATKLADAADGEMSALSKRIFAAQPITLRNLKQRAVLARYWHQYAYDVEEWAKPEDCGSWEDEVIAQLIHGVLQINAPPDQPSPDLGLFLSALQGVEDYSRAHPEPQDVKSVEYDAWYAEHSQRLEGLNRVAERILSGSAPPLDVLAAIASEYVLLGGHPRAEQIADAEAHDGIPDWVVKRLVHALLPIPSA